MSMATLRAGRVQEPLRVGDPLPTLKGQLLTGRDAALPQAASGKVTLVAIGFTYQSRVPVEAWADWHRKKFGSRTDVTLFEVPMIGGLATLGRWFIDRGMRSGTPVRSPRPSHHGLWWHRRVEATSLLFSGAQRRCLPDRRGQGGSRAVAPSRRVRPGAGR